jgi:hypothetical protein
MMVAAVPQASPDGHSGVVGWAFVPITVVQAFWSSHVHVSTGRLRQVRRRGPYPGRSPGRRTALPDSADAEGISATGKHGVLDISIPKKPETTPRRISVAH